MSRTWTLKDLEYWDERIREKAEEYGLSCFPQEFDVCDQEHMLGYMAYHGMPAQYPHWSFGKAYEKLKTLYDYGVSGLPYEMVINANPSLAYLMRDNSLCLQVLTIAHVYGHNDFFRNNFMFRDTRPELTISLFKLHADRIRHYLEDPSIGQQKVEETLDAAHALSMQTRRDTAIRKLTLDEQRDRALADAVPPHDPYEAIHKRPEYKEPNLNRVPIDPEEDLLLFIAEHNPYLTEWQRDLLRIVHAQTQYFLPQIETKIMNEGWASYWHHRIMNSIDLPEDLYLEFLVHHNQVVRPHKGSVNPYHLGFKVWHDIERRYSAPTDEEVRRHGPPEKGAREKLFEVRETDRDISFLRRFLTRELMEELHMFEYKRERDKLVVSQVADEEHWMTIKQTLLRNVGMGTVPVIRIVDADYRHNRALLLRHEHDGRDLEMEYVEKTMGYLYQLWGRPVLLETRLKDASVTFSRTESGFERIKN
ncbi:stage V sporulation protein R [Sulfurifustis variabilis]|uniref:Stage V sporulation protein R n=1 Tax=Sulfurifustis variabilis TaxID=1675686 RepID=A0A1B4V283_9GAMM|nr:SpoVR family protein [Sulfurifustis variabilis]BAU47620.1 stage V sporulation protein R [Sulfurifustis variabilis]